MDLERITFIVDGAHVLKAVKAIEDLPDGLMGDNRMRVVYDPENDRSTIGPVIGNVFPSYLTIPAGLDSEIVVYSPADGERMRTKVSFGHKGHKYVVDPNVDED
jgi:hypothetical protein